MIQFTKSSSELKWIPNETHRTTETFIEAFNKELETEEKNLKKQSLKATLPKMKHMLCKN